MSACSLKANKDRDSSTLQVLPSARRNRNSFSVFSALFSAPVSVCLLSPRPVKTTPS